MKRTTNWKITLLRRHVTAVALRRMIGLVTVSGMTLLGLVTATGPAQAKVPGSNGRIAFVRFDAVSGGTVTFTANPDGSHEKQLFPGESGDPHWSPDGSRVAISCDACGGGNAEAVIVNPDTGSFRVFLMPPTLFIGCHTWSPDARRLACEGGSESDPSRNGIYTIRSSDGRGLTRITSNPGGEDIPIDYSPSGKQIVFGRTDPTGPPGSNRALFVVKLDGSGLRRITPWGFSDDDGGWSPNAGQIVFEHFGALYTVHPDGTGLTRISLQTGSLTTAFAAFDAGWSPDGTKIVFALRTQSGAGTTQEGIATANADGSDVQVVTTSPTRDDKADWGPHPLAT